MVGSIRFLDIGTTQYDNNLLKGMVQDVKFYRKYAELVYIGSNELSEKNWIYGLICKICDSKSSYMTSIKVCRKKISTY